MSTHYFEVTVCLTQKVLVAIENDDYEKAKKYAHKIAVSGTEVQPLLTCVVPLADDLPEDIQPGDTYEPEFPTEVLSVVDFDGYTPEDMPAINPDLLPVYNSSLAE